MSVLEMVREAEASSGREASEEDKKRRAEEMRGLRDRLKQDLIGRLGLATVAAMLGEGDDARARSELSASSGRRSPGRWSTRSAAWGPSKGFLMIPRSPK